ncbi:MAG: protein kinase [Chloroflexota bacterium]
MGADSLLGLNFDEYRIEKPLGAGGMAKVYRALDVKLKRYVALKVIAADFRSNSDYTARFEREAQSIARLEHSNIVQIYRFGEANGMYYMAMQYIDGADLGWLIRDYKNAGEMMPLGDILRVMQEVGAALDYAHGRDVIHRDVKPSNIMVDNRGRALLTDFGLALLGDVGTRGEVFGSPHYIAPEQTVSSANVVPQSDIYSLGITLFEMLTGDLPFTGGEALDLSIRHLSETPLPPSQFNTALPPAFDEVVLRALEKDPFDRYQTCGEFSDALRVAVASFQVTSTPAVGSVKRPSLVLLPQKVHAHLQSAPQSLPDIAPTTASIQSPSVPPSQARATTVEVRKLPANSWKRASIFAALLFVIGIIFIFVLLKVLNPGSSPISEPLPTSPEIDTRVGVVQASTSLTPTPSLTATAIALPIDQAPTPFAVILPPTLASTTVESPSVTLMPTEASKQYVLLIKRQTDQSLFIVNIGLDPFPVNGLRIGNEHGTVVGAQWQVGQLDNGQCVSLWKSDRNAASPDVTCTEVGTRLMRNPPDVFWNMSFTVYYNELPVKTCDQDTCLVRISGR